MKIAVTGSCGFIGSHLVKRLAQLGTQVVEIDITKGIDVSDWQQLEKADEFDLLFHLAAKSYVPDSYESPRLFYYSNIIGTLNALELCRIRKAQMVYVSSYVYGRPKYLPIDEKHPVSAFNPYAQTKIIAEQLCQAYNRDFALPVVIVRPFNIYGPGQNENFLIPTIIRQVKTGKVVLKDPRPKRDFLFVDDFIELLFKLIDYDKKDYACFNAGSSESFSIKQLVDIINDISSIKFEVVFENQQRKNEIMDTVADISKAKKILNWRPKVTIKEGLQRLI